MKAKNRVPPTRYGKSRSGCYFYVVYCTERDARDRRLFRLRFLAHDVTSKKQWTLDELDEADVRWLKNKPTSRQLVNNTKETT